MNRFAALLGLAAAIQAHPAQARLDVCNETDSRVGIAIGYHDGEDWVSEGWWHLDARQCGPVVESALIARYYYLFALDLDAGGGWSGQSTLCVAPGEFIIAGRTSCEARGHNTAGFFEIDTATSPDWTVRLDGANRRPDPRRPADPLPGPSN